MTRRTPRSYSYRIPIDDSKALRKINVLDSLHADYWIDKIHTSKVPTAGNGRHFGHVFYQSKERYDWKEDKMVGGTIPGFGKYRYSLEWQRCPAGDRLEMRNANGGGTKIQGEIYTPTEEPMIPNWVPIDIVVEWTPSEIKNMFEHGVDVHGSDSTLLREALNWAVEDSLDELEQKLWEYRNECDHDHVVETGREYGDVAYCETCGRGWDRHDYDHEKDELTVVGTA